MLINNAVLTGSFIVNGVNYITNTPSTGSNTFVGTQTISGSTLMTGSLGVTGSVSVSGSITATGTLTAQTLVVQTVTSSIVYSSGSNIFGNQLTDVQQMTGSLRVTGSITSTGAATFSNNVTAGGNVVVQSGSILSVYRTDNTRAVQLYTTSDECVINSWEATGEPLHIRSMGSVGRIQFFTSGSEKMRITSEGNVGIGTTSPSYKLQVRPTTDVNMLVTNNGANLQIGSSNDAGNAAIPINFTATSFTFNNTASFTSNVGIGVTNPSGSLSIKAETSNTPTLVFQPATSVAPSAISNFLGANQTFTVIGSNAYVNNVGGITRFNASYAGCFIAFDEGEISLGVGTNGVNPSQKMRISTTGAATFTTTQTTGNALTINVDASSGTPTGLRIAAGIATIGSTAKLIQVVNSAGDNLFNILASGDSTFSGRINSSMGNDQLFLNSTSATTGYSYMKIGNTSGGLLIGLEGSTAANLQTGDAAYSSVITTSTATNLSLGTDQVERLRIAAGGAITIPGSLSKGSGTFRIDHPLESKKDTHQLVHSFVEGPRADLIYRGTTALVNGTATINIDTSTGMTEGTFVALNRDIQCFTTNESGWDLVKGKVEGNILTITSQNTESTNEISWMVVGERQDEHIKNTDWTDENGRPILEPLKIALENK